MQEHADQHLLGSVLYPMCDHLPSTMRSLAEKKVKCSEVFEAGWGTTTTVALPSEGKIGLYQPRHPTPFGKTHRSLSCRQFACEPAPFKADAATP